MKTLKIGLAWHNLNSSNYGVSALAIAHLNLIVQVANENNINLQIDTLGFPATKGLDIRKDLESRLGLKIGHIGINLKGLLKDFLTFKFGRVFKEKQYDYVFDIGEGDSFADIYGFKRFFFMSITKYFSLNSGAKLILAPQTIGPFSNPYLAKIAKALLKKSYAVYVRDYKTYEYLNSIGVNSVEVSDVAFVLPFDAKPKIDNSIGLNVSGLLWHGGYTQNNQFGLVVDYPDFIIKIVDAFLERNKNVHLIAHVISDVMEVEDDYRVILKVKKRYENNPNVVVAPKFKSPIEAKSYISQMTFFMGSRMHSTIGSLSAGVATVPLAYSRKFTGVFGSIEYPYTIDIYGERGKKEPVLDELLTLYDHHYDEMNLSVKKSLVIAKNKLDTYVACLKKVLM